MSEHRRVVFADEQIALTLMSLGILYLHQMRLLPEGGIGEGGEVRRGGRGKGVELKSPAFNPAEVPIPPQLDSPEFRTAWTERLGVLKSMGCKGKLTEPQVLAKFRKMIRLRDACGLEAVVLCIERATEGRHQGEIFPDDFHRLRPRNGAPSAKPAPGSTSAQLARAAAIDEQEPPSIWESR